MKTIEGKVKEWYGFDLDGTLAHYDGWKGIGHIGDPIKPMVDRVKRYMRQGKEVRIFTARVSGEDAAEVTKYIEAWCEKHIGKKLPVTCQKDFDMAVLFDDRCVQVVTNTGEIVGAK